MGNTYPIASFTVTPSLETGGGTHVKWTLSDANNLLTTTKLARAVILDAIDQWITTNSAQLVTNGITIGNDPTDTFGGSDNRPGALPGNGGTNLDFLYTNKTCTTPKGITTTSLSTDAITVSIPYADVL
tara:strand:+ start:694 stop:1080 length:387 start_codon:yes stop_codon:yes gene_type:complete